MTQELQTIIIVKSIVGTRGGDSRGEAQGMIWADSAKSPDLLLVWSPYQAGFQLMGKPSIREKANLFRIWFVQTILPFLKKHGMDYFEYSADTKELWEWFRRMFPEIPFFISKQKVFCLTEPTVNLMKPEGYHFERITDAFLQIRYRDKEFILDEIRQAHGNRKADFEKNIIYTAIKNDTVVARASMLFRDSGFGNISVFTKEPDRRKGLSSYLVKKTVEDMRERGLVPIWDCTEDNLASERTARKCGFRQIREELIGGFATKEITSSAVQAKGR
ncbi:MAG: GNAT family N-acetyltransferase [Fusicatenibacter sp.]